MKKAIITLAVLLAAAFTGRSQQIYDGGEVPDGYRVVDTVIFSPVSSIDTTLTGLNVWNAMPEGVSLEASSKIRRALEDKIKDAPEKTVAGYRIRIFFDNKQDARTASEDAEKLFLAKYHGMRTYRSYDNPYFKVTVGDFRTKGEAQAHLQRIKRDFPTAFVVKERFRYPALDPDSFKADTLSMLVPIETPEE